MEGKLLIQIALGTGLLFTSILISATAALLMAWLVQVWSPWFYAEPHLPKLVVLLTAVSLLVLGVITTNVWLWALHLYQLSALATLEESVYFSLVSFTTLGFGDVILPKEWRILSGMIATNGFLNFGILTALMVEALRHVRVGQHHVKHPNT